MKTDIVYTQVKFGQDVWHDEPYDGNPPDFFDRETEKRMALDLLLAPDIRQAVWLVGERRAGKTSLLHLLLDKCEKQRGFVTLEVPWQVIDSARAFYRELLGNLDERVHGRAAVHDEEVKDAHAFWSAFQSRKQALDVQTIVIAIDEFDGILQSCNERDRREIHDSVYRLIEQPGVKIIRATCPKYTEEPTGGSPISLVSKAIEIHPFTDYAFKDFVRSLAPSLSESEVQELGRLSGNWPYYAKAVLYHFLQEMSGRDMRWAQERATESVGTTCTHLYLYHWNREERQALLLLARKRILEAEEFGRLDPSLRDAFRMLVKRGYLAEKEGRYCFRVGLIEAWLQSWVSRETEENVLGIPALLGRLHSSRDPWRKEEDETHVRITKDEMRRRGF